MFNNSASRHVSTLNCNGNPGRRDQLVARLNKSRGDIILMQDVRGKRRSDFTIDSHKLYVKNENEKGSAGGVCVAAPGDMSAVEFEITHRETQAIKFTTTDKKSIIVINTYIRPKEEFNEKYFAEIKAIVEKNKNTPIYFAGDFNSPNKELGSGYTNDKGRKLLNETTNMGLKLVANSEPTYYSYSTNETNILDFIFTNEKGGKISTEARVWDDVGSNHMGVETPWTTSAFHGEIKYKATDRKKQKQLIEEKSKNVKWTEGWKSVQEIDNLVEEITRIMEEAKTEASFERKRRYNAGIKLSEKTSGYIREARKWERKRRLGGSADENKKAEIRRNHNYWKRMVKICIEEDKRNNINQKLHKTTEEGDMKATWKELNKTMERDRKNNDPVCKLRKENGEWAETREEVRSVHAERMKRTCTTPLNEHHDKEFMKWVEEENKKEEKFFKPLTAEEKDQPEEGDEDFEKFYITEEKLNRIIDSLKDGSSPGPDLITHEDLKTTGQTWRSLLRNIMNECLRRGYFPKKWKVANVSMLLKPGKDRFNSASYRPISLTSCVGKVFERCYGDCIDNLLEERNILQDRQAGFRKGRSCMEGVVQMSEDCHHAIKNNGVTVAVFLDCAKAFDGLWHDGIKRKMRMQKLPTKLVRLLSSFLDDRKMRIKDDQGHGEDFDIDGGVPQGGINSPRIYNIYKSDAPQSPEKSEASFIYADDVSSWACDYTTEGAAKTIQDFLYSFQRWCAQWRMNPEASKSSSMVITRSATQRDKQVRLEILGAEIKRESSAKFLGATLDSWMSWKPHIDEVTSKARQRAFAVNKVAKVTGNREIVHDLLGAIVYSVISYAAPAFYNAAQHVWDKVDAVQQMSLKLVHGFPLHLKREYVLRDAVCVKLSNRIKRQAGKRMEGIITNAPYAGGLAVRVDNYDNDTRLPTLIQSYMKGKDSIMSKTGNCILCKIGHLKHPCVKSFVGGVDDGSDVQLECEEGDEMAITS